MATRKRTDAEAALMTDANILKVIKLLEQPEEGSKPVTKKDCCAILGMAYNTTRLATIIDDFKAKRARDAQRRAELRGKPATRDDVVYIISEYLRGETVDSISKMTYRGSQFIKTILEFNNVPLRTPGSSYFKPELVPEGAIRTRFAVNETVYSARYDSLAKVKVEQAHPQYGFVYQLWLLDDRWQQYCYQPAEELASLEHLRELGVAV